MHRYLVPLAILLISCQSDNNDRIVVPENIALSTVGLLEQIRKEAANQPENERLLRQELYYCEQLGWPTPCNEALLSAKKRWGLTENLIDQMVAYHLTHENHEQLQAVLKGAIETRPRLEAKIRIATLMKEDSKGLVQKYLDHYSDKEAVVFSLRQYLERNDTIEAIAQFEKLNNLEPTHELLRAYYPILIKIKKFNRSTQIINNQLIKDKKDAILLFDLAGSLYALNKKDSAKSMLRKIGGNRVNEQLMKWYRSERNWDSSLYYLDKLLIRNPEDRALLLAKAETLESKKWITYSLPYYERVLQMNPSDTVMLNRVEIVRRKVAYLRQNEERKKLLVPLNLTRKTTTDN